MSYRSNALLIACCLVGALFLFGSGCGQEPTSQIDFPEHSQLRLGFTTQNFLDSLSVSVENKKELIDYAAEQGYSWIELRDPDATLSSKECEELADYAREQNVEIGYTNQRAFLDADFWDVFSRGMECARAFEGPGTIRVLASGEAFTNNEEKRGYTAEELDSLVANANRAATRAEENGLQLVVENALEPVRGDGETYFGLTEFFERVDPAVGWQLDTANFFSVSRVPASEEEARTFLQQHADRLHYIHLKSAQNGETRPVLGPNPLEFDLVFDQLAEHNAPYVAIELGAPEESDDIFQNHEQSLEYLQEDGFITLQ